ncbi:MAG: pre-peptidase C-terminal domain-containing protein [Nitrospirae bacterium]|nr:pre-peptidase C-terminal domain-containing protein [Nitrospirota bacterium]
MSLLWKMGRRSFIALTGFAILVLFLAGCGGKSSKAAGSGRAVTIAGTVQYEDKTYDSAGFNGTALKPVRKAVVEVVRNTDGAVLASGSTDPNGGYSLTFTNTGTSGVYVRVRAQTADNTVSVNNFSGALYAITTLVIDDSMADSFSGVNLTATTADVGGVFNILDVLFSAAEFITTLNGGTPPPPITGLWESGNCDGTYFNSDDTIHILGGGSSACPDSLGDTDEYDDSVLAHEYGHFISAHYSRDNSPGGIHYLNDNTQDIRLSWSEGWGNFFSSAVRNDPLYVDTKGSVANISFNIEDLSSSTSGSLETVAIYTTNEISVAAVLWDIFDTTPAEVYTNTAGTDAVSAGMGPIWDVIANYFRCKTCGISNVSFEDFWDGWFNCPGCTTTNHGSQAGMDTVVADRKMALTADGFEPDDTVANAKPVMVNGPTQTHTLYPATDVDYVSFVATGGAQYTITTEALTNGADTFLEVFGTDGTTLITSNDDATSVSTKTSTCSVNPTTQVSTCPPNDATTLSSKVVFTPTAGGTYYVRVKRSPTAPPSAGAYGSYDLKITSP